MDPIKERVGDATVIFVTAATKTLSPVETKVKVDTTSNVVAITLPPAEGNTGLIIDIYFETEDTPGGNALTVADPASIWTTLTFDAADDRLSVRSTGMSWTTLENVGGA